MTGNPDAAGGTGSLAPGAVLAGRYRIRRVLGSGGMGDVYEAEDLELGTVVALKTLRAARDERSRERFRREILLARKVTHPNVSRIFDFGSHDAADGRVAFLTMELLGGRTLEERIAREGPLPAGEALRVLQDVAAALTAAHAAGVVHRDLKSANVMLVPESGGAERAVVTDFGLATSRGPETEKRLTDVVEIVGTPDYMAPEQVEGGEVGPATDIYALGLVAYEMLSGRLPFEGATPISRAVRRLSEDPVPLPVPGGAALPPGWSAAILRCLAREPGRRFPSPSEFVRALSSTSGAAIDGSATRLMDRPPPRRRLLTVLAGAAVALAALAVAVFVLRRPAAPVPESGRRSVAILGFANLSGLPDTAWLATALSEMLATELASGQGLRPLPGETVARARADLNLEPAQTLSAETLARIRKSTGASLVVHGTYFDLGARGDGRVRLDVRLVDAVRGELLATFSEGGDETGLDTIAARAGERLREALGSRREQGAATAARRDREAARLHAEGLARLRLFDARGAEPFFRKAVERDPADPRLHAALAETLWKLGRDAEARGAAEAAFARLESLPREERLEAEGRLREIVGDTKEAIEAFQALRRLYPDDLEYGLRLAAVQSEAGNARGALATVAALRKLPAPAGEDVRLDLAEARALSEAESYPKQVEVASRAAGRAGADGLTGVRAHALRLAGTGLRALGKGDEAARAFEEARALFARIGDRAAEGRVIRDAAGVAWDRGDLAASRREVEKALAVFREIGDERGTAVALETMAVLEKQEGRPASARTFLAQARELYVKQGDEGRRLQATHTLANILVSEGDLVGAERNYREVLDGAVARGSDEQAGLAETNLGSVLLWQGRLAEARRLSEGAVESFRRSGSRRSEAYAHRNLARIDREEGALDEADLALGRAAEAEKAAGDEPGAALIEGRLEQLLARGNAEAAAGALGELRAAIGKDAGEEERLVLFAFEARIALARGGRPRRSPRSGRRSRPRGGPSTSSPRSARGCASWRPARGRAWDGTRKRSASSSSSRTRRAGAGFSSSGSRRSSPGPRRSWPWAGAGRPATGWTPSSPPRSKPALPGSPPRRTTCGTRPAPDRSGHAFDAKAPPAAPRPFPWHRPSLRRATPAQGANR